MNVRFPHRLLLIAVLSIISIWGALGERTPFNNGLGWDGKNYALLTSNVEYMATHHEIDSYQYQRILSPVLLFYTCKFLHVELSVENIPHVFRVYNLLLIAVTVWLFFKLCSHLRLKPHTETIGFTALFFNYFILKNTPYYPILTDISGFCIGMLICFFFFTHRKTGLLIAALVGHFTFPLVFITAAPLCLTIRNNGLLKRIQSLKLFQPLVYLLLLVVAALIALILFYPSILDPKYTVTLNLYLLPLSILWVLVYIRNILGVFNTPTLIDGPIAGKPMLFTLAGIIGIILISNHLIAAISIPEDRFTPRVFLFNILQQAISLPFISIIAHATYLGPAIVLLVLFFKPLTRTIQQHGDSAIGYFIIIMLLGLGSETRQFVPYYPFLVVMLMLAINEYTFTRKQVVLFGLLAVVSSKCWFPINVPDIFKNYDFAHFPDQRYFMNHGPFMGNWSYVINLAAGCCSALCVYGLFRKAAGSHTNFTDSSVPSL